MKHTSLEACQARTSRDAFIAPGWTGKISQKGLAFSLRTCYTIPTKRIT